MRQTYMLIGRQSQLSLNDKINFRCGSERQTVVFIKHLYVQYVYEIRENQFTRDENSVW